MMYYQIVILLSFLLKIIRRGFTWWNLFREKNHLLGKWLCGRIAVGTQCFTLSISSKRYCMPRCSISGREVYAEQFVEVHRVPTANFPNRFICSKWILKKFIIISCF